MRPITESGLNMLGVWLRKQKWEHIVEAHSVDHKAELLHETIMENVDKFLPQKIIKVSSDDSPWCTDKVKNLKRLKCREYNKHRKSEKWRDIEEKYQLALSKAKSEYYKKNCKISKAV